MHRTRIVPVDPAGEARDGRHAVLYFEITGTSFLYHQIRCMMAVLFMVGRGVESPDVVLRLMDVAACPAKPLYDLALDAPLTLFDCGFGGLQWLYSTGACA